MSAPPAPGPVRRLSLRAHAKINLDLRVGGRRRDGYHDLRTILQSIGLHDTLTLRAIEGGCRIRCSAAGVPSGKGNLVHRAAQALWTELGRDGDVRGVAVTIRKRIPVAAGLGGGTADAVAALRGLCVLWGRTPPPARLNALAAEVGADGPFFLVGGTALGAGRGDEVYPLAGQVRRWVVVAVPPYGVSTAAAYGWLDEDRGHAGRGWAPAPPPRFDGAALLLDGLHNDLEGPVARRRAGIGEAIGLLSEAGASRAGMTGSGSAVFGLFERRGAALEAVARLRGRPGGWNTSLTRTMDRARLARRFVV